MYCLWVYCLTPSRLWWSENILILLAEAKKMADQAMKDPMSLVNNVGALKFW